MEIAGISLQLAAGIIFGLAFLLPVPYFEKANNFLQGLLLWPLSDTRRRLQVCLVAALLSPVILLCFSVVYGDLESGPWYETAYTILFVSALAGFLYLQLLSNVNRLLSESRRAKTLLGHERYQLLLGANWLLAVMFSVFCTLIYFSIALIIPQTSFETGWQIVFVVLMFLLLIVLAISLLSLLVSIVFATISLISRLLSMIIQQIRKPIWLIALLLFITGGGLLIANAVKSA